MKTLSTRLVGMILMLVVFSCKKEESDQLFLWVDPASSMLEANSGDIVSFTMTANSPQGLENVKVQEKKSQDYMLTIADSTLTKNKLVWQYQYKVPYLEKVDDLVYLYFEATDAMGEWVQVVKILHVITSTAELLTESTGHVMYSSNSNDFDAFNLISKTPLLSTQVEDSLLLHIKDDTEPDKLALSRTWISPAGLKFVRFNDLDFGNATKSAVKTAYENGLKRDYLDYISVDDVILTKIPDTEVAEEQFIYVAIKVIEVIDEPGTSVKDRYIFSIKK